MLAILARGHRIVASKKVAHHPGTGKSVRQGYLVQRLVAAAQGLSGFFQPQAGDVLHKTDAHLFMKQAGEPGFRNELRAGDFRKRNAASVAGIYALNDLTYPATPSGILLANPLAERLLKAAGKQQQDLANPAGGFQPRAGSVIEQRACQQLIQQMPQRVAVRQAALAFVRDSVPVAEKFGIELAQPAGGEREPQGDVVRGAAERPALIAVNNMQGVLVKTVAFAFYIQRLRPLKNPQQRQDTFTLPAEKCDLLDMY